QRQRAADRLQRAMQVPRGAALASHVDDGQERLEILYPVHVRSPRACRFGFFRILEDCLAVPADAGPSSGAKMVSSPKHSVHRRNQMGAPSPELCNLWLARAFNAHDTGA